MTRRRLWHELKDLGDDWVLLLSIKARRPSSRRVDSLPSMLMVSAGVVCYIQLRQRNATFLLRRNPPYLGLQLFSMPPLPYPLLLPPVWTGQDHR